MHCNSKATCLSRLDLQLQNNLLLAQDIIRSLGPLRNIRNLTSKEDIRLERAKLVFRLLLGYTNNLRWGDLYIVNRVISKYVAFRPGSNRSLNEPSKKGHPIIY